MDLQKMFETQKVLRERINYNEPDRFHKIILALLVEIGELANEWRGFKFWSKNQEPRTKKVCQQCAGRGIVDGYNPICIDNYEMERCPYCEGIGLVKEVNPLLEEYVDGLHFVLELGLEKGWTPMACDLTLREDYVNIQFIQLFRRVSTFYSITTKYNYYTILELYVGLGEMLGFTWEQIEQAYYEKNKINHQRQVNGY